MKVALIGPYPVETTKIAGGVAAVTYYLAQGLVKQTGIELHVVAPTKLLDEDRVVEKDGLTVHYLAHRRRRLIPNQMRDIGRIRPVLRQIAPDIVHSQLATGAIAAAKAGFPCVQTIHGIPQQEIQFARTFKARTGAMLEAWLTRRALRRTDSCIAISKYVIDSFPEYTDLPWFSVHNPIEDRFFEVAGREVANKLLFAGMMYERKNIPGLIRAFKRVHNENGAAELFICGKVVEPEIFVWAERYVADNGLQDRVHLLGFVSQDELARHFAEAAIICLFSREETAPMIIAQAMCAGKPVVSTAAGGVPDLMIDGETGYVVDVGDEAGFADRTLRLLSDEDLRSRMGVRGREIANELFRSESVATRTYEVYRKTLAGRRS